MVKEIIVDTDPGIDDTLALMYLAKESGVRITDLTTVPGNTDSSNVLKNANYIADMLELDIPIYQGPENPINRPLETATSHGESGLGSLEPDKNYLRSNGRSKEALLKNANKGKHLLTLGPLTNVGRALSEDPELLNKYETVTVMGGGIFFANHGRTAEFNFYVDPEAADKVIRAEGEKKLVPADVCNEIQISYKQLEKLRLKEGLEEAVRSYINQYKGWGRDGGVMYDPLAAVLASKQEIGDTKRMDLRVETTGKYTRGMTVPQLNDSADHDPNTEVYRKVQENQVKDIILSGLK